MGRGRPSRIEVGGLLAGLGAILLLIALFLDWFEPGLTAWTVFEALDLVLAAAAVAALAFAARSFGFSTIGPTAATAAGTAALLVVVSQLIDHPPAALEADIEAGAWLGLAGAALMFLGALMSRTGVSLALEREYRGGPATVADSPPGTGTPPGRPGTPGAVPPTPAGPGQPEQVPPTAPRPPGSVPAAPGAPGSPGPAPSAPPAPGHSEPTAPLPPQDQPR